MVDSLSGIDTYLKTEKEEQIRLVLTIAEGTIEDPKRGLNGGFSRKTIASHDGDTVYLIQQHDNLDNNLTQSYYFQSGKLVFSRIELQRDDNGNATLFLQEMYYVDDKAILAISEKNGLRKKWKWRVDFDQMAKGYSFLMDFKKEAPGK